MSALCVAKRAIATTTTYGMKSRPPTVRALASSTTMMMTTKTTKGATMSDELKPEEPVEATVPKQEVPIEFRDPKPPRSYMESAARAGGLRRTDRTDYGFFDGCQWEDEVYGRPY